MTAALPSRPPNDGLGGAAADKAAITPGAAGALIAMASLAAQRRLLPELGLEGPAPWPAAWEAAPLAQQSRPCAKVTISYSRTNLVAMVTHW